MQLLRNIVYSLSLERCSIALITIQTRHFRQDSFNQVTDCHSRWDSVRVDNHIGHDAFDRKRQVLLAVSHSAGSFLTVTTSELVSNLRHFDCSHFNFHESAHFLICGHHNLVNVAFLRVLQRNRPVFVGLCM